MWAYVVRRLVVGVVLLLGVSLVTFALFFAAPADQAKAACGKTCTQAQVEITERALGYDKPVVVQWGKFVKGLVVGRSFPDDKALEKSNPELITQCDAPCLGYSKNRGTTVNELIADAAPVSISLAVVAVIIWLVLGVGLGIIAAVTKGTLIDRGLVGLTLVIYAFPTFFIGFFFLKFMAIRWKIFDIPSYVSIADGGVGAWLSGLMLPSFTLALVFLASYVRMTRAFVLESMGEDYIRTARAKGLPEWRVLAGHALRNAALPMITILGLQLPTLLGGALVTETVFTWPGMGRLFLDSISYRDYPVVMGVLMFSATMVLLGSLLADILYAAADPRIRLG